jgi:hypothetical protein
MANGWTHSLLSGQHARTKGEAVGSGEVRNICSWQYAQAYPAAIPLPETEELENCDDYDNQSDDINYLIHADLPLIL